MTRALAALLFGFCVNLAACAAAQQSTPIEQGQVQTGGTGSGGRSGGAGSGGAGSGGASSNSGGSGGSTSGSGGTGGNSSASGGTGGGPSSGAGGASSGGQSGAGGVDAPVSLDTPSAGDGGGGLDGLANEGNHLPNRPDLRICKKEWTAEQCCDFLCRCLQTICRDSPKGKPGIATCKSWCPKISSMAQRCHVYHCFVSISPTGGIKDHDSHCGHAANEVAGGGCPAEAYQ